MLLSIMPQASQASMVFIEKLFSPPILAVPSEWHRDYGGHEF
jgi:hypothetical protein